MTSDRHSRTWDLDFKLRASSVTAAATITAEVAITVNKARPAMRDQTPTSGQSAPSPGPPIRHDGSVSRGAGSALGGAASCSGSAVLEGAAPASDSFGVTATPTQRDTEAQRGSGRQRVLVGGRGGAGRPLRGRERRSGTARPIHSVDSARTANLLAAELRPAPRTGPSGLARLTARRSQSPLRARVRASARPQLLPMGTVSVVG